MIIRAILLCLLAPAALADGLGVFTSNGEYRGDLTANEYNINGTDNAYGQYGSEYSINNVYLEGSEYSSESAANPYSSGFSSGFMTFPGLNQND